MNYKNLVLSLGLAAAASGVLSAQNVVTVNPAVRYSETKLNFNLTLEYQVPNLKPKDSEGKGIAGVRRTTNQWFVQKYPKTGISDSYTYNELGQTSVKVRYGNREIIDDLVAQAVPGIPSNVGWYLTAFTNPQGQPIAIYARHSSLPAVRLDPTYIELSTTTVPSLTQLPTDVVTDPPTQANVVDTYAYNGHVRQDIRTSTSSFTTYFSKGTRKATSRNVLTFKLSNRFPINLAGDVRLVVEKNANAGAAYPPTWIPKSLKSTGVILAGQRKVRNEANAEINVHVLADGTITGTAGTPYFVGGAALPPGVTLP